MIKHYWAPRICHALYQHYTFFKEFISMSVLPKVTSGKVSRKKMRYKFMTLWCQSLILPLSKRLFLQFKVNIQEESNNLLISYDKILNLLFQILMFLLSFRHSTIVWSHGEVGKNAYQRWRGWGGGGAVLGITGLVNDYRQISNGQNWNRQES